jgi:hypothetical protein
MNLFTRISLAALMVPFIQCQAEVGDSDSDFEADSEVVSAKALPIVASWYLTGPVTRTVVVGFPTLDVHTLGNENSTSAGAYAVLSRERSDDPCYVYVGTEDLNTASLDSGEFKDHCGSGGPTSSTIHADYLDVSAGGVGDHDFITGIHVCLTSSIDKVKGIGVDGVRLNSNGTITQLVRDPDDDRTNCNGWTGWVYCPTGQIATAVDAHFAGTSEPKELLGLALACRALAY